MVALVQSVKLEPRDPVAASVAAAVATVAAAGCPFLGVSCCVCEG